MQLLGFVTRLDCSTDAKGNSRTFLLVEGLSISADGDLTNIVAAGDFVTVHGSVAWSTKGKVYVRSVHVSKCSFLPGFVAGANN